MTTQTDTAVRAAIDVDVPPERAFQVFTEGIGDWWNPDHHIIEGELAEMVLEPRVGGHIYDRATDGSVCRWATVLAYDPPERFVFSWNINLQWKLETDPAKTSEVEVRFMPLDDRRTRVELEHRHLERHGEGWESMREGVGSAGGWPAGLERFAGHLTAAG